MIAGVISDSHDNCHLIKRAVEVFKEKGVEIIFHAGDYVAPFSLRPLLESFQNLVGVFGNNDGEKLILAKASEGKIKEGPRTEIVAQKRILIGHDLPYRDSLARSGDFDLIISGHTHVPEVKRLGDTLLLNPGELGGWLYGKSTVAIVDLTLLEAEIITLP